MSVTFQVALGAIIGCSVHDIASWLYRWLKRRVKS